MFKLKLKMNRCYPFYNIARPGWLNLLLRVTSKIVDYVVIRNMYNLQSTEQIYRKLRE